MRKIWGTNSLEENLGAKLGGGKRNGNQILLEANSFGNNFLEEILGASFGEQKFLGEIFACEISFGEENTAGEQKCFGEEGHGEQKFLGAKIFWE